MAGVGGFELSDPEKPPLEPGLTATEGRSARHIHCRMDRMDWTGVQVTLWQLSREKSLIAKRSEMKGNSAHTSKASFGSHICEFESSHPSQPVRSPLCDFRVCENRRHSRGLGWRALVSGWQILEFRLWTGGFAAPVSACHFPIAVSANSRPVRYVTETGLRSRYAALARCSENCDSGLEGLQR